MRFLTLLVALTSGHASLLGLVTARPTTTSSTTSLAIPAPTKVPPPGKYIGPTEKDILDAKQAFENTLAECQHRKIDIYGPIPSDCQLLPPGHPLSPVQNATGYNSDTKVYLLKNGTDASLWASARVFADEFPEMAPAPPVGYIDKRQAGRIQIGLWRGGPGSNSRMCSGESLLIDGVIHDAYYYRPTNFWSVSIGGRRLGSYWDEYLGFWNAQRWRETSNRQYWCGQYQYAAYEYTKTGCFVSQQPLNCFSLQVGNKRPVAKAQHDTSP